jgi:beta-glucosidase
MHGPTCIFWANLTPFSLKVSGRVVSCTVTNNGTEYAGSEVVQLYLKFPSSTGEPPKQLKGWDTVRAALGWLSALSVFL